MSGMGSDGEREQRTAAKPVATITKMRFGDAILAAEAGCRIARQGWNGKGMWLVWMPPFVLKADTVNARTAKYVPPNMDINVGGYFVMWTATQVWQPGWLASQADMIADDWAIVC